MANLLVDARIKFTQSVSLQGPSAMVSSEVFGGPLITMQVAVFDANDNIIDGVGFPGHGEPLTSELDGTVSWLFVPKANAAYIKWGVIALRSAAGLGRYSVSGKVRDAAGNTLVSGRFSGQIPDGEMSDGVVYDGVKVSAATAPLGALPKGPST